MATYRRDPEGEWLAAVRGGSILFMPSAAAGELTELWAALSDVDPFPAVIERLTARGLVATPPFALVVRDDGPRSRARVVVRGPIVVRAGATEIRGAGVSTWAERVIDEAATLSVGVEGDVAVEAAGAEPLPVVEAMVSARAVHSDGVEVVATPERRESPAVVPSAAAPPMVTPPATSAPAVTPPAPTLPSPILVPAASSPSSPTPAEQTIVPSEETVAGVPTPARAIPPMPASSEVDAGGDHDGLTVAGVDLQRLRQQRAASRGSASDKGAPAASAHTPMSIRMPDGTVEPIGHEVVLGRAPSVSKVSGVRIPRLITIGAGDPDISRSHVRLAVEGDTVVITDLHSRNGTHVAQPGKAPVKLRAGEPTPVLTGTVVDLGGGWTLQVVGS